MRLLKRIIQKILRARELSKYNDFTIAEYFRKQGAIIGESNRIEVRSFGPEPFLIKIGNHCTIGPNVLFVTHDGATWLFTEEYPSMQKFASIVIEDNCFIGVSAILMGGITIGSNSIVGAGAVVTKNVPCSVVVAGNPARILCTTEEYKKKVLNNWKIQKPQGYFEGIEDGNKFSPDYIQRIKERDFSILRDHLEKLFWGK